MKTRHSYLPNSHLLTVKLRSMLQEKLHQCNSAFKYRHLKHRMSIDRDKIPGKHFLVYIWQEFGNPAHGHIV
jgi:cellulose synthase/poly-beta-1,6-N-acetylglucosamine synthase-like glycosyltransferase